MSVAVAPAPAHLPVLRDRVAAFVGDAPAGLVVDCTVGAGGHARAVLEARIAGHGEARLLGIDRDPEAIALASEALADLPASVELVHARFDRLGELLDARQVAGLAAVVFDLGVSSMHLDRPERGFSYRHVGPLDMRMDPGAATTAADVVNTYPRGQLADVIRRHGEERFADRIAAAIVRTRPLTTTTQLAEVVRDAVPAAARRTGPHPATRTFQALRVEVNEELAVLATALPIALERLLPGGVCVAIAYHSLEDRIVKRAFASAATGCTCPPGLPACVCGRTASFEILTRRPLRPDADEVAANPRARSARLRAARRLTATPRGDVRSTT